MSNAVDDVGLFEGATLGTSYWRFGLFRPTDNARMRSNQPEFGPVCYEAWRDSLTGFETRSFSKILVGDFNGDAMDELIVHNGNSVQLFLSDGGKLNPTWGETSSAYNSSIVFHVADFDADGKDDFYRILPGNRVSMVRSLGSSFQTVVTYGASLTGWQMAAGDRFAVGDWNADGRQDLMVWNHTNWGLPALAFYTSTGSGLQLRVRYDNVLPAWTMAVGDRYHVGDFDGDGRDEIAAYNGVNWASKRLTVFRFGTTSLAHVSTYTGAVQSWTMASNDQHFVGDFNADGKDDIFVFNGSDWSTRQLAMIRSSGVSLQMTTHFVNTVSGWSLGSGDRFTVADVNGDGRQDLVALNTVNPVKTLGNLRSNGSTLAASVQGGQIGNWTLGAGDSVLPANFNGGIGAVDLIIRRPDRLGMLRSNSTSFSMVKHYPKYIRNVPFHASGWW